MKIERVDKKKTKPVAFQLRLQEDLLQKLEKAKDLAGVSRNRLIELILTQALEDKGFVLKVSP